MSHPMNSMPVYKKLNLGCGSDIIDGWDNIDSYYQIEKYVPKWVIPLDVMVYLYRLPSNSVDEIKAHHILEHMEHLDPVMEEMHRVCIDGALLDIIVPLAGSVWDVANPNHKRHFNPVTFRYYTRDFKTSDLGLFQGFDMVSQILERAPDVVLNSVTMMEANLHTILKVAKGNK